jgi:hypothetical protein
VLEDAVKDKVDEYPLLEDLEISKLEGAVKVIVPTIPAPETVNDLEEEALLAQVENASKALDETVICDPTDAVTRVLEADKQLPKVVLAST